MNMDERIKRINELYHKSQNEGLTDEEKLEQTILRQEYVDSIKRNMKAQLDNIEIERPDGTIEKLKPGYKKKKWGKLLITERILGHQWYYLSDTILGFVSYGSEICTTEILESALQDGKNVYVPKVEDGKMEFYRMFSLSELKNGYKKIPEPAGDTDRYVFEPEHADKTLLLMPGSAFDPLGNRMGYGGGFYDRYLADKENLRLRSIGIGFRCQQVEQVPVEVTDVKPYQVILV